MLLRVCAAVIFLNNTIKRHYEPRETVPDFYVLPEADKAFLRQHVASCLLNAPAMLRYGHTLAFC